MPPAARNAAMRYLKAVFNFGIKRRYLRENPIARLDFIERPNLEVEVFTAGQVSKMLSYAFEHDLALLPFLVFGSFCGIPTRGRARQIGMV